MRIPFLLAVLITLNLTLMEMSYGAVPVELMPISRERVVEHADLVGNLRANDHIELSAEVAGIIKHIRFVEGGKVAQGDVLIELDDQLYSAELRRAEANYQLAMMRFERDKKLFEKNTISQAVFEESQAELYVSKAALDVARVRLQKSTIVAPIDAWVGLRTLSVGDYISPGDKLMNLINDTPILVDFNLPQRLAGTLRIGDEVSFTVANQGVQRRATIIAIEPSMNSASRSLAVRAQYANETRDVLSGNFASVSIDVEDPSPVVVIPSQALIGISGGYVVYLAQEGKAVRHLVKILRREHERVVLEDNFPADVELVVAGHQKLRPGSDLNPVRVGE